MADLTDSDFYIYSEISDLNAARADPKINLPPLRKNPSVSRGEIVSPQPGEDLYAHNFINLNDWSIAAKFMNRNKSGSSTNRTNVKSNRFIPITLNISSITDLFSNSGFFWTGQEWIESIYFDPLINKTNLPTDFSADNWKYRQYEASFIDGIRSLVETDQSMIFDTPDVFEPTVSSNSYLAASDLYTSFASFRNCAQNLCSGYVFLTWFSPSVKEWNTSHSSDPPEYAGPWTPTEIGPYKRVYQHYYLSDGSTTTAIQTSVPVYNDLENTILNCAYVKSSSEQTIVLKNARDFLDFTFYVVLYQKVIDEEHGDTLLADRYSFSKATTPIGSIIKPQGSSEVIFRLDPDELVDKIYDMQLLDPSQYASPDKYGDYNVYVDSDVQIAVLASLKNPPTP